jgi:hypothetical protein
MQHTLNENGSQHIAETKSMQEELKRLSATGQSSSTSYQHSFGALPNGYMYSYGLKGIDHRHALKAIYEDGYAQMKAMSTTTGGAGTAGYALIPVYVDSRIHDESRKYTPLVELIPRVTNQGMTADYNVITAKGGGYTALEDAALPETNDTYVRRSKPIKFLYAVGRVTGPSMAAMPSYMLQGFQPSGTGMTSGTAFTPASAPNAKQLEVLIKARAMKELEENLIINGDSTTDATQYDGIIVQQSTTNQLDLSAAALTWDDVETAVRYSYDDGGRPKLAVGSSSVIVDLRKIMIDTFRYSPAQLSAGAELPFGVPAKITLETMVGQIPAIPSMFLSNVTGSKQLWFLDTDYIEMRVLQDMTYEELAKTNDSQKFMLKIYECLVVRAPAFNSYIDNIA